MKKTYIIILAFLVAPIVLIAIVSRNPLNSSLSNLAKDSISSGKAQGVSVYVKDIESGKQYGVKENTRFLPASLAKVPLLMAYLKQAETQPSLLDLKAELTPEIAAKNTDNLTWPEISDKMEVGNSYTVHELLERLIKNSDNDAALVLETYLPKDILLTTISQTISQSEAVSPKEYSNAFEMLYKASYLSQEASTTALDLLSSTAYTGGLVAGVPSGVRVAHKYGVYQINQGEAFGLNDCGIVFSEKPYLICVMTIGKNLEELQSVIKAISFAVYTK